MSATARNGRIDKLDALLTTQLRQQFRGIGRARGCVDDDLARADSRGIDNFANNAVMGQAQEHAIAVVPNLIDFNASLTAQRS